MGDSFLRSLRLPTWGFEALVVASILIAVASIGNRPLDFLCGLAVLLSFMHAQVSDRMVEMQGAMATPSVHCFRWSARYFVGKELCWCAFFVTTAAWPALAGVVLFLAYPVWRKVYRSWRPPFLRESVVAVFAGLVRGLTIVLLLPGMACVHRYPCADLDCRQAGAECAPGWECAPDKTQVSQWHCLAVKYAPLPPASEARP